MLLSLFVFEALALAPPASAATSSVPSAAWVRVAVATLWDHPSSPTRIDAPSLLNPAAIGPWLKHLSVADRLALDSRIATQALYGEPLVVLGRRGVWSHVEVPSQRGSRYTDGIIAWVPTRQVTDLGPPIGQSDVVVVAKSAFLRSAEDGTVGQRQFALSFGTELPLVGRTSGYDLVGLPGGGEGAVGAGSVTTVGTGSVSGAAIVANARSFLGLAYLWGGTSAYGYDCSGLVYSVFARYGIVLPRDAADQQHAGQPVAKTNLRPGDLLFFAGPGGKGSVEHVAIYAGAGQMIDAPYTGAAVELVAMQDAPIWNDFAGATRIAGVH